MTDSIAAVEAAWGAKAKELGLEPAVVIAATHGRRASDNLLELVPGLKKEHVDGEVDSTSFRLSCFSSLTHRSEFERTILAFADTPPQSRKSSFAESKSRKSSFASSRTSTSTRTRGSASSKDSLGPLTPLSNVHDVPRGHDIALAFSSFKMGQDTVGVAITDDSPFDDDGEEADKLMDMSVRILPGVRELIDCLPTGKYAVATSGAKTYCHGCLNRTG